MLLRFAISVVDFSFRHLLGRPIPTRQFPLAVPAPLYPFFSLPPPSLFVLMFYVFLEPTPMADRVLIPLLFSSLLCITPCSFQANANGE